jgi:hypothetical protein
MEAAACLSETVGISKACSALAVPRSSYYRAQAPKEEQKPRPKPVHALSALPRPK